MTRPMARVATITSMEISGKYQEPKGTMSQPSSSRSTGVTPTQAVNCSKNVQSGFSEVHGTRPMMRMIQVRQNTTRARFWRGDRERSPSAAAGNSSRSCWRRKNCTDFSGCAFTLSA